MAQITAITQKNSGFDISVRSDNFFVESNIGDSVSVDGICLTITQKNSDMASFFVQEETVLKTTIDKWEIGRYVNLEHPLRLNDLLSGHLVQGHIDGVGSIYSIDKRNDDSWWVELQVPDSLQRYVAYKGSICINGVSLTVAEKTDNGCVVALIPSTISLTTFQYLSVGEQINIEVDCIARYVEQLMR